MVRKSYKEQFKLIKEDVRQTTNKMTRDLAKEAKKDMEQSAHSIINDYYYSYLKDTHEPKYYVRTHNLYNMFYINHPIEDGIANGHKASLTVASIGMFDNYRISPNVVFDLVWNQGHRGLPFQNLIPTWNPTIDYDGFYDVDNSPHILMSHFINKWGNNFGKKKIDKIFDRYKSNEYKSFM